MKITRISQSCFMLQTNGTTIYVDPYKIEDNSPRADVILITHPHMDHASRQSISIIQDKDTKVFCPQKCSKIIKNHNATGLAVENEIEVAGIAIKAVPAYNVKKFFHKKKNGWLGYIINDGKMTLYHAGDTDFIPEMKSFPPLDIVFLPIGGFFTMNKTQAIDALKEMVVKRVIPMHELRVNPDTFANLVQEQVNGVEVVIIPCGKTFNV